MKQKNSINVPCISCGKIIYNVSRKKKYCDKCARERVLARVLARVFAESVSKIPKDVLRDKTCIECGAKMKMVHHNQKFCRECGKKRKNSSSLKVAKEKYKYIMKNWKAMSEKEQLKRMNELSKKLLNKTTKS